MLWPLFPLIALMASPETQTSPAMYSWATAIINTGLSALFTSGATFTISAVYRGTHHIGGHSLIGHRLQGGKDSATFQVHVEDKHTHTHTPVHFLDSIPVNAVLAFPGKVLGSEEGRVNLKIGHDQQEGCLGIPGGEKVPKSTWARLLPFWWRSNYYCMMLFDDSENTTKWCPIWNLLFGEREVYLLSLWRDSSSPSTGGQTEMLHMSLGPSQGQQNGVENGWRAFFFNSTLLPCLYGDQNQIQCLQKSIRFGMYKHTSYYRAETVSEVSFLIATLF